MSETSEPCSVLIVDDDHGIREVLSEVLVDAGYQIASAEDGARALDYLQQAPVLPRVILLDLMMPVMTGWEFRLTQQQNPRIAPIPVVALSARGGIEHEQYAVTVDAFMRKPVDLDQLLDLIEDYCA
jgi:CheY-like chemotaxis protein